MKPQFPTEHSESGEFERQEDAFRDWISNDGSTPYPADQINRTTPRARA